MILIKKDTSGDCPRSPVGRACVTCTEVVSTLQGPMVQPEFLCCMSAPSLILIPDTAKLSYRLINLKRPTKILTVFTL